MERLTRVDEDGTVLCIGCVEEEECNEDCLSCQHDIDAIEKLAEYEDLEEQAKLIRLPCKVGDKIYHIEDGYIYEFNAEKIEIRKENGEYIYCIDSMDYRKDDFGKIAFFTVEEAEQALAKMKEV
jgi:hypothetical protein